jgi:hypothetical protein
MSLPLSLIGMVVLGLAALGVMVLFVYFCERV